MERMNSKGSSAMVFKRDQRKRSKGGKNENRSRQSHRGIGRV